MFDADGRSEESRLDARRLQNLERAIQLRCQTPRARAPETSRRMRVRVVSDRVATARDFGDELRQTCGAFADDEEGRTRVITIEQIENARRIVFVRAVVDRQPNRWAI